MPRQAKARWPPHRDRPRDRYPAAATSSTSVQRGRASRSSRHRRCCGCREIQADAEIAVEQRPSRRRRRAVPAIPLTPTFPLQATDAATSRPPDSPRATSTAAGSRKKAHRPSSPIAVAPGTRLDSCRRRESRSARRSRATRTGPVAATSAEHRFVAFSQRAAQHGVMRRDEAAVSVHGRPSVARRAVHRRHVGHQSRRAATPARTRRSAARSGDQPDRIATNRQAIRSTCRRRSHNRRARTPRAVSAHRPPSAARRRWPRRQTTPAPRAWRSGRARGSRMPNTGRRISHAYGGSYSTCVPRNVGFGPRLHRNRKAAANR